MNKIFLLLIFLSCVSAFNPSLVSTLESRIVRSGAIYPSSGDMYGMVLNLSIPQRTDYQSVTFNFSSNYSLQKVDGNEILVVTRDERRPIFTYEYVFDVHTRSRSSESLNETFSFGSDLGKYTEESDHVKISRELRELAHNITKDYKSDIDKVAALAIWVNKHVVYDLKEVGKNKDSLKVYREPRGVCVEYTNLFLALARSLGYPSRAVYGYVYSPQYGWQRHSWAEVYIGEWIGVDPTWLEVGYIDATHIPLYFGKDTEFSERVSAHLTDRGAHIVWEGNSDVGVSTKEVNVLNYTEEVLPYEVKVVPEKVFGPGDTGAILITMNSPGYRIFKVVVSSCTGEYDIVNINSTKKDVFMHPGLNNVIIPFEVSSSLQKNYNYLCPITVSHSFGTDVLYVTVNSNEKKPRSFSARISEFGSEGAYVRISTLSNRELFLIDDYSYKSVSTYEGYDYDLHVGREGMPSRNLLIYDADSAEYFNFDFSGTESNGDYTLNNLYLTEDIPTDREGTFSASFTVNSDTPYTVMIFIDDKQAYFEKSNASLYEINYSLRELSPGKHKFSMILDLGFDEYRYESTLNVFEPRITVDRSVEKDDGYLFYVSGPYSVYELYVDGRRVDPHRRTRLDAGEHTLHVEWVDKAGYRRVYDEKFNVADGMCRNVMFPLFGFVILFFVHRYVR